MSEIPSPTFTPEIAAYLEAFRARRFIVPKCNSCGQIHWYPRAICPFCMTADVTPIDGPRRGVVYSCTTVAAKESYHSGYVALDGGPTILVPLLGDGPYNIGDIVVLDFVDTEDGQPFPAFRLADRRA